MPNSCPCAACVLPLLHTMQCATRKLRAALYPSQPSPHHSAGPAGAPQVVHTQLQEEASARASASEAHLKTTRDEAARLQAELAAAQQQLEEARDAVKVGALCIP